MPLNFTTEPDDNDVHPDRFLEEDQVGDEEEGVAFEEETGEGEPEEEGSVASVSDYQGGYGGNELPERMIFSNEECRVIFSLKSDGGRFMRVWVQRAGLWSRGTCRHA
jgi:hypothetical protein